MLKISTIIERMREQKRLIFFLVFFVVAGGIALFFWGRKMDSPEVSKDSASEIASEEALRTKQAAELDVIANALPRYSEEEISQQYLQLDALRK